MGDAQTFWLSVTNAALGIVVAVCLLTIAVAVVYDIAGRARRRSTLSAELDRDMHRLSDSPGWVMSEQSDPAKTRSPGGQQVPAAGMPSGSGVWYRSHRKPHFLPAALRTLFLCFVSVQIAGADTISDWNQFLTQAQTQMQSAFGSYSWAYSAVTANLTGTTTVDGFFGSFTADSANKQITLSKSDFVWCDLDNLNSCISNGPEEPYYTVQDETYATGSAAGAARAQIGSLGATASAGGDTHWGVISAEGSSDARVWDTITISPSSNYWGYLQVDAIVLGQLAVSQDNYSNSGGTYAGVAVTYGDHSGQQGAFASNIGLDKNGTPWQSLSPPGTDLRKGIPISLKLVYGPSGYDSSTQLYSYSPVWFYIDLTVDGDCSVGATGEDTAICAADSNFQDTLRVTGLEALDSSGNPIPGATLVAASGYNYNGPAGVPEPATLVLLATALALGALVRPTHRRFGRRSRLRLP